MSNKYALIIEDNEPIAQIYQTTLTDAGFDSEYILNGRVAAERLKEVVPDLIMLDMNLPQVSGHYLFKEIRADARLANTYVIIATANTPMAEALKPQLTERDALLIKPVSPSELRELVLSIL